jgi:hypothetical protein
MNGSAADIKEDDAKLPLQSGSIRERGFSQGGWAISRETSASNTSACAMSFRPAKRLWFVWLTTRG